MVHDGPREKVIWCSLNCGKGLSNRTQKNVFRKRQTNVFLQSMNALSSTNRYMYVL